MKVGLGYCNEKNSLASGKKAARLALENGDMVSPDIVLSFCSSQTNPDEFFRGLQSVLGEDIPIVGGSAIGIITNDDLSYEGYPCGVALIQSNEIQKTLAVVSGLDKDEKSAGRKLGKELSNTHEGKILLLFYDSIKSPSTNTSPPIMNASRPLVEGIQETLKSNVPIIGIGVLGDFDFGPPNQFCGSHVDTQSAVGILASGGFEPYFRIAHGCTPKDGIYHTITRIEGSNLYEVDGKPIVEMIDAMYGNEEWRKQKPVSRLTIGINHGEKYGAFEESCYVNRLIAGALPNGEGVVLFEPDLEEGTEILFMLRDGRQMIESARRNSAELLEQVIADGRQPVFGLYIDCAGRTARISHTITEEASEVQKVFNQYDTPLLGVYSGVEVSPLLGKSRGLDWTGVLLVLAKD
ncbi:MAG: FIST C-terminal domain-containing protein [Proteobacteria bacterium]|nr:FIST C-terminal domain-containing protein [Pseudomonadota bacterium]